MSRTQKSRTGTASKKKVSPEQKASHKKTAAESPAAENNENEKSEGSKRSSDFGYDSLARQTLDLWREQLSHFLNNPDAMSDINKVMEPAAKMMPPQLSGQISQMFTPLFSGGMDIWLMMLEQLGKAANMNTKGATETTHEQKTAQSTSNQSRTENRSQDRATTASALSGASAYALAGLASRLADLEKRFAEFEGTGGAATKKPARKTSTKKKTTPSVVAAVKRAKQQG